jgi:hypothetical protein
MFRSTLFLPKSATRSSRPETMWDTMNASREKVAELHDAYVQELKPAQHGCAGMHGPNDPRLDGSVESPELGDRWFLTNNTEPHETETAQAPACVDARCFRP